MFDQVPETMKIKVISGDDQGEIEMKSEVLEYSEHFNGIPNKKEDYILKDFKNINITDLRIINKFYDVVINNNEILQTTTENYLKTKINSKKLADALPEEIIEFMDKQGWLLKTEENQSVNFIFDELKAKNTWEACLVLGFELMGDIFMQAFCARYYCSNNVEEVRKWCQTYNLRFELTSEEMRQIRMEQTIELSYHLDNVDIQQSEQQFQDQENVQQDEEEKQVYY